MKTRSELKREAKDLLKGHWGKAIGLNILQILPMLGAIFAVMLLLIVVMALIASDPSEVAADNFASQIDQVSGQGGGLRFFDNIFGSILTALLATGVNFTLLDWLRTKNSDFKVVRGIFGVFTKRDFLPVVVLWIIQTVFEALWSILFIIPGIIKSIAYSQTYYIYKDIADNGGDDDLNYLDYVTKSRQMMKGHKAEYFVLQLSFIGWNILAIITLGIGYIWLIPYQNATYTAYYKSLAESQAEPVAPEAGQDDGYFEE